MFNVLKGVSFSGGIEEVKRETRGADAGKDYKKWKEKSIDDGWRMNSLAACKRTKPLPPEPPLCHDLPAFAYNKPNGNTLLRHTDACFSTLNFFFYCTNHPNVFMCSIACAIIDPISFCIFLRFWFSPSALGFLLQFGYRTMQRSTFSTIYFQVPVWYLHLWLRYRVPFEDFFFSPGFICPVPRAVINDLCKTKEIKLGRRRGNRIL